MYDTTSTMTGYGGSSGMRILPPAVSEAEALTLTIVARVSSSSVLPLGSSRSLDAMYMFALGMLLAVKVNEPPTTNAIVKSVANCCFIIPTFIKTQDKKLPWKHYSMKLN